MAYYIVETVEQLRQLPKVNKCFIQLVTLSEKSHPSLTTPCLLYYNDFEKGYIIPVEHTEGFSVEIEYVQKFLEGIEKVYLLDKKWHSYYLKLPHAVDVYFTILETQSELEDLKCYTKVHADFYHRHGFLPDINSLIPLSKHYEKSECMFKCIEKYIGREQDSSWYEDYVEAYKWVEEQGITLNERDFDKHFEIPWKVWSVKDNRIYTSYNLFNTTSRPTNAFNGVNFLALSKHNGSRAAFVPENDSFVEFDFDGYHLRLIANLLEVEIPVNESIHVVLGRKYFNKQELTPEEYEESKKITFRQLYNGVEPEYRGIELFAKVVELTENMWKMYQEVHYLELPNKRRVVVENPTPQKLLNYYIQCLETVNNVKKLLALKKLLQNKKTRVVLVVYDSILVDYSVEDGIGLMSSIKNVLEEDGFRVKGQKGINYDFYKTK